MTTRTTTRPATGAPPATHPDPMRVWNQVFATDPAYTKGFQRGGGFRGTAIDALYNIRRATEIFGPIGIGWGIELGPEQLLTGGVFHDKAGNLQGHTLVHEIKITLWFRDPATGERGAFPASGATTFVQKFGSGTIGTDEEVVKKSITDAISKALSWLGFSADVHLGLFDDNKYIDDLKRRFAATEQDNAPAAGGGAPPRARPDSTDDTASRTPDAEPRAQLDAWVARSERTILDARDKAQLQTAWETVKAAPEWAELKRVDRGRAARILQGAQSRLQELERQLSEDMGGLDSTRR